MSETPVRTGIEQVAKRLWSSDDGGEDDGGQEREGGVQIDGLGADDVEEAASVIAEAFRPERFTTAALGGNDDADQEAFASLIAAKLRVYRSRNQPLFVARDDDGIVGVVILARPAFELSRRAAARVFGQPRTLTRLLRPATLRNTRRVLQLYEPPDGICEANYRLEYIAVHPDRQSEGIGRQLLDAVHTFTDRDPGADGVYLATAGEQLREMYVENGYETVEIRVENRLDIDGEPLRAYHMHRPSDPPWNRAESR